MGNKFSGSKRSGAALLALICWIALGLQYILLRQTAAGMGLSPVEATVRFFSYFTIESNILAALVLTAFAIKAGSDFWLARPFAQSAVTTYMTVVGLIFSILLRQLRPPQGLPWAVDLTLHDFMPVAFFLFWLICVRKAGLRWRDTLLWLIYPLIYLMVILVRGAASGFYPYPFVDAGKLGYAETALNAAGMTLFCATIGAVILAIGRWLARRQTV